jgi:hypothetical protein
METCPYSEAHSINVYGRVLMDVQGCLKSVLDRNNWSTSRSGRFNLYELSPLSLSLEVLYQSAYAFLIVTACVTYCTVQK